MSKFILIFILIRRGFLSSYKIANLHTNQNRFFENFDLYEIEKK